MFHDLAPTTIASAVIFGMILALLGSIKLPLAERLQIDEPRVGGLLAALNLAFIPLMLVSGILVDQLGVRWVVLMGSLLTAIALFFFGTAQTFRGSLGYLLLIGAGASSLSVSAVVLMPQAFFDGRLPAASANLGCIFFGLGALITPALTELLIRGIGYRRTLCVLAVLCLGPAFIAALTPGPAFHHPVSQVGLAELLSQPIVWLTGLVFLLYIPLEGAVGTWATSYLMDVGFRQRPATFLLSGFWLTLIGSRLVVAVLQERQVLPSGSEAWTILCLALLAAVMMGNLAGNHSRENGAVGLLLAGALLGPIFPTLIGILFNSVATDRGAGYGAMFAIGSTGSLVLPSLMGMYARQTSIRAAFRIPTIGALILAAASLVLALTVSSHR